MHDPDAKRIVILERRQKRLLAANALGLCLLGLLALQPTMRVSAQQTPEARALKISELSIVDSRGIVRVRLGGICRMRL